MLRSTVALMILSIFLCLTLNYTFPINRHVYHNIRNDSGKSLHQNRESIIDRTKKMAANLESAIRKIKDTTQDLGKNIYDHINIPQKFSAKCLFNGEDLREYEKLVIKKKYPYLELNNFDTNLNPTNKNVRHNIGLQAMSNFNEPSVCEPNEESINVEIFNRGLSGVAIPSKNTGLDGSIKNNLKETENLGERSSEYVLDSLRNDVDEYLKRKGFYST